MIDIGEFQKRIKNNVIDRCYIFCGYDEQLIKENIKFLTDKTIENDFYDFNYIQFDGNFAESEEILNACETVPFMSRKRAVVIYRADFLKETEDRNKKNLYDFVYKYINNIPEYCMLILYCVFESKREKPSKNILKLDKKVCTIKADRLKGEYLVKKVKEIFDMKGKNIGVTELRLFCSLIEGDMGVIENEADKLYWYTYGREIKKEDINALFSKNSDKDIFDVVDFISQRKVNKALELLNELITKGEKIPYILYMIERQFKLLLLIKTGVESGKNKNILSKELKLNPYICEKMIIQDQKFTIYQIETAIKLCIDAEQKMKSTSCNQKTEMELLIINAVSA